MGTMGARRRKLNRELLGIDREEEKDEESFGFKDAGRSSSRRQKYIEARKANSETFVTICVIAVLIFGLVLWAHKHHL